MQCHFFPFALPLFQSWWHQQVKKLCKAATEKPTPTRLDRLLCLLSLLCLQRRQCMCGIGDSLPLENCFYSAACDQSVPAHLSLGDNWPTYKPGDCSRRRTGLMKNDTWVWLPASSSMCMCNAERLMGLFAAKATVQPSAPAKRVGRRQTHQRGVFCVFVCLCVCVFVSACGMWQLEKLETRKTRRLVLPIAMCASASFLYGSLLNRSKRQTL